MTRPMDRPAMRVLVHDPKPAVDVRSSTRPDRDGTRGMGSTKGGLSTMIALLAYA